MAINHSGRLYREMNMRLLIAFFCIGLSVIISTEGAASGNNYSTDEKRSRIEWIQNRLDEGAGASKMWQYGWTGIYSVLVTFEGANALDRKENETEKENDKRHDAAVNAATSILGIGGMVFDPMKTHSYAKRLTLMPDQTDRELTDKLEAAERFLEKSARRQQEGRSWKTHTIAAIVNLLAGVAVAADGDRPEDGLVMFATGMAVSEVQIFTTPADSVTDLQNYRKNQFGLKSKSTKRRLFAGLTRSGIQVVWQF